MATQHSIRRAWWIALAAVLSASCVPKTQSPTERPGASQAPPSVSLHLASLRGDTQAVAQHIAAHSALDSKDEYGSTPLTIAITFGRTEVAEALIAAGADLTVTDQYGSTPLHLAAFFARPELVPLLLEAGADRQVRSSSGATAFDIAQSPFEVDRATYDSMRAGLSSLGLDLDYSHIAATRPQIAALLTAPSEELQSVSYAPQAAEDFAVSTPAAEGLDPALVAELFVDANAVEKLFGLGVLKNGRLIAEGYFHGVTRDERTHIQSVTKSFTSAAVGIALERGCLKSVDQKLVEFFPEYAGKLTDPNKQQVSLRHLLQMRGGYPWEEAKPELWQALLNGALVRLIQDFPLENQPGQAFAYSNLSSHWLGVVVARACHTDLKSFEERELLTPMGIGLGEWLRERDGYYVGLAEMQLNLRDMAKFGLLYLDEGVYRGKQLVPRAWVRDSLTRYSDDAWVGHPPQRHAGRYFRDLGYGYQWWSADVDGREVDFAWGHGGQLIVLLEELNMVVVAKSEPWRRQSDAESWRHERATLNLVGKFIRSLPK